jgi:3-deoxy-7-phosphoheptulonate synthase
MSKNLQIKPLTEWKEYNKRPFVVAGPCSAESEKQVMETAIGLKKTGKVDMLRAGIWKPRTRPNSFEGVGVKGLPWLKKAKQETGLPLTIEVANANHVYEALKYGVDILWLGARTTANPFAVQEIANAIEGADVGVMIKNPVNPDLALWIGAIERIYQAGIRKIGLIHRGFSTYEKTTFRNLPQWQIPIEMKSVLPQIPMLSDPSHIGGDAALLQSLSQKAMDLNFDGLMIESHNNPKVALSDAKQQITPDELGVLLNKLILRNPRPLDEQELDVLEELRGKIDWLDNQFLDLIEQRMQVVKNIGEYKKRNNISILQNKRWEDIIYKSIEEGAKRGLSREFINRAFKAIHQESINHQMEIMNGTTNEL